MLPMGLSLWITLHRSQGCEQYSVMLQPGVDLRSKGCVSLFLSIRTQDALHLLQKTPKMFLLLSLQLGEFEIHSVRSAVWDLWPFSELWACSEGHGSHAHFFC